MQGERHKGRNVRVPQPGECGAGHISAIGGWDDIPAQVWCIPATGWKTDSSVPGYTNYIDIAISGLTAADYVAVDVAPSSSAVARAANFVATESRAGILRLRAASAPTATISAQYHIITAATAAKEG